MERSPSVCARSAVVIVACLMAWAPQAHAYADFGNNPIEFHHPYLVSGNALITGPDATLIPTPAGYMVEMHYYVTARNPVGPIEVRWDSQRAFTLTNPPEDWQAWIMGWARVDNPGLYYDLTITGTLDGQDVVSAPFQGGAGEFTHEWVEISQTTTLAGPDHVLDMHSILRWLPSDSGVMIDIEGYYEVGLVPEPASGLLLLCAGLLAARGARRGMTVARR